MTCAKSCATCAHFDLPRVLTAAGRINRNKVAACQWQPPADWVLPESITTSHSPTRFDRVARRAMSPDDGAACLTWEAR